MFIREFMLRTHRLNGTPQHDGQCIYVMDGRQCAFTLFRCSPVPPIPEVVSAAVADRIGMEIVGDCICYYVETRHSDPSIQDQTHLRVTQVGMIAQNDGELRVFNMDQQVSGIPKVALVLAARVLLNDLAFVTRQHLLRRKCETAPDAVYDHEQ